VTLLGKVEPEGCGALEGDRGKKIRKDSMEER